MKLRLPNFKMNLKIANNKLDRRNKQLINCKRVYKN